MNATETGFAPMRVSVRTRLATAKVCCIRRSIELRSVPAAARGLIGIFHLAENLRLAEHHRIQSGGDAEQMPHRRVLCMRVQKFIQAALVQPMMVEQPALRDGFGACFDFHVQLGAVAGGNDQRFIHTGLAGQVR